MIWADCQVGRTGYRMIDEILIKKLVPELIEDYCVGGKNVSKVFVYLC